MSQIGQITTGSEIGWKRGRVKYIWVACVRCGKERWVELGRYRRGQSKLCFACHCKVPRPQKKGPEHWKYTGRCKRPDGYVLVKLKPDEEFFSPMAGRNSWVMEHRLVMAKFVKRCLLSWEVVHHRNGIRDDNRLENLELLPTRKRHAVDNMLRAKVVHLEKKVAELETQLAEYKDKEGVNGYRNSDY